MRTYYNPRTGTLSSQANASPLIDDDWVTAVGRLFQTRAAAAGNALSPIVDRFVLGTTSAVVDADRRLRPKTVSDTRRSWDDRYDGAVPC